MKTDNILEALQPIARDIFDNEDINLSLTSTAEDVEEWDSISHIQFISSIEQHFQIKFTTQEILKLKNVGDIISTIEQKIN